MYIESDAANEFMSGYKAVLLQLHESSGGKIEGSLIKTLARARRIIAEDPGAFGAAIQHLSASGIKLSDEVVSAISSIRVERWIYLKNTTKYAIFLDVNASNAYAVLGLTSTIDEICGGSGVHVETAIFSFRGNYVCDGIVENMLILGPNYMKEFRAAYSEAKKRGAFFKSPSHNSNVR